MISRYLLPAAALLGLASAQTTSDCNPLNSTDCPANPAFGADWLFNFNSTPSGEVWETTVGHVDYDAATGAAFTINKQGDCPTIRTNFYFFFGRTEIWLKAAPGKGIISSMMWLSDDLDEVDWEFLGFDAAQASSNYFGKGIEDFHNGGVHAVAGGTQDDYHNYTTTWTQEQLEWWIDGQRVRTLKAAEANNTETYPQTPMRLSLGIWAAGDPTMPEGTREWAGGDTDYAAGPYTMYVKKAQVTDYSSGKEYVYGDQSGTWKSIEIVEGNSTAIEALTRKPEKTTAEKWAELPASTKTGVYAGAIGVAAIGIGALGFYFWKQRRQGASEAKLADEKLLAEQDGFMSHRNGHDAAQQGHSHEYNSAGWARLK